MDEICIQLEEDTHLEFEEIDIGVADDVIAFDVSGRIVGLDEAILSQVEDTQLVPTELRLEPRDSSSSDGDPEDQN